MKRNVIDKFQNILIEMRKKISGDFERSLETSSEEFGTVVPDMTDEATRTMSRRILLEMGDKSHDTIIHIDDALDRIEKDEFGVCEKCEEDIPEKRLMLLPYAKFCVECQESLERKSLEIT